jgi:hypothetical protein
MILSGTIANAVAVLIGGLLGLLIGKRMPERFGQAIIKTLSIGVIVIGIMNALTEANILVVLLSLAVGTGIGEWIDIEKNLERMTHAVERRFIKGSGGFTKGFVTATLLFCVGSMAIMGALEGGLSNQHQTLYAKSVIDGIVSVIFAATLGIGVAFSSLSVLVYQGVIALLAGSVKDFLSPEVIGAMTSAGGMLIMGLGVKMLLDVDIKVGNMLPAVFLPVFLIPLFNWISGMVAVM